MSLFFTPFSANKKFDLSYFRKDTLQIVFDAKYGIDKVRLPDGILTRSIVRFQQC